MGSLTVTALSVERYLAICHPFLAFKHQLSSLSRAIKTILVIWPMSLICALVYSYHFTVVNFDDDPFVCALTTDVGIYLFCLTAIIFFVIPLLLISIMYLLIGLKLGKPSVTIRKSNELMNFPKQQAPKMLSKNKCVLKKVF